MFLISVSKTNYSKNKPVKLTCEQLSDVLAPLQSAVDCVIGLVKERYGISLEKMAVVDLYKTFHTELSHDQPEDFVLGEQCDMSRYTGVPDSMLESSCTDMVEMDVDHYSLIENPEDFKSDIHPIVKHGICMVEQKPLISCSLSEKEDCVKDKEFLHMNRTDMKPITVDSQNMPQTFSHSQHNISDDKECNCLGEPVGSDQCIADRMEIKIESPEHPKESQLCDSSQYKMENNSMLKSVVGRPLNGRSNDCSNVHLEDLDIKPHIQPFVKQEFVTEGNA